MPKILELFQSMIEENFDMSISNKQALLALDVLEIESVIIEEMHRVTEQKIRECEKCNHLFFDWENHKCQEATQTRLIKDLKTGV